MDPKFSYKGVSIPDPGGGARVDPGFSYKEFQSLTLEEVSGLIQKSITRRLQSQILEERMNPGFSYKGASIPDSGGGTLGHKEHPAKVQL